LDSLLSSGGTAIKRPSLGLRFLEPAGGSGERGVVVQSLDKVSPLDKLNLKPYNKISAVNNETITDLRTLPEIILDYRPGSKVELSFEKEGKIFSESVILK